MKQAAMLFVTVATIAWGAAAAAERGPEPTPSAAVQIPRGSMIGWAISKWDVPGSDVAGALGALEMTRRGAIIGSDVGGLLGGIAGAVFGGALGGL